MSLLASLKGLRRATHRRLAALRRYVVDPDMNVASSAYNVGPDTLFVFR